jgi:hypothetical protein
MKQFSPGFETKQTKFTFIFISVLNYCAIKSNEDNNSVIEKASKHEVIWFVRGDVAPDY